MERVVIFIDGSNFYHCLKNSNLPTQINFYTLSSLLVGEERNFVRTYYYNAAYNQADNPDEYARQLKFFAKLRRESYIEVKLGRLVKRGNTYVEKGVDIHLATDMLKYAYSNLYDTAILISGDGDYVSAVLAVKDLGKHVVNAFTEKGCSDHLIQNCDRFITINHTFLKKCLKIK